MSVESTLVKEYNVTGIRMITDDGYLSAQTSPEKIITGYELIGNIHELTNYIAGLEAAKVILLKVLDKEDTNEQ